MLSGAVYVCDIAYIPGFRLVKVLRGFGLVNIQVCVDAFSIDLYVVYI